ncbi:FAD dependent oxidoreductase superfamily [Colletotrichum higginsianum IMI 349063]|uniref:FAD dependent oxidoreductase superfamily n=1 Tax=Colletotrichum higginsianum (strain IMI 349063) TaxID=759273 RepID=A0A1B7Y963_COLHI|nr:FAD dependent oxidoreductase superfamily [Colletotrichum higginsianum IMI 349063]OBR08582.1 FAD dependent oxidoreductase superfamily [Colletotrichum higginsianum IMI 349063]
MSNTVILGSGIIGLSVAYYLADHQPGSTIHLVEPSPELFASASGYAAGFLARDWFPPASAALGAVSFDEHRRLAAEHGGRDAWGWSASTAYSHSAAPTQAHKGDDADWLRNGGSRAAVVEAVETPADDDDDDGCPLWLRREHGDDLQKIGDSGTAGQVDPLRLCRFLLDQCRSAGVHLHHPAVVLSVNADLRGDLASVRIGDTTSSTESDVPCTRLVVAAGAWSPRVFADLFPGASLEVPISSLAGHSLVVRPSTSKKAPQPGCHAIFGTDGAGFSPELFSRVGGDIYIAGVNSSVPLPQLPGQTPVSAAAIAQLKSATERLVDNGDAELEVVRQGLCFRPVTASGTPILTRVPDDRLGGVSTHAGAEGGVFLAAGHGPWGISLGLGTGRVMAEMMQGRKLSADVSRLALT